MVHKIYDFFMKFLNPTSICCNEPGSHSKEIEKVIDQIYEFEKLSGHKPKEIRIHPNHMVQFPPGLTSIWDIPVVVAPVENGIVFMDEYEGQPVVSTFTAGDGIGPHDL